MSLESAKVNFNIFLFVATEARNLSDIFVESFRLHMLSRFLFIYQLNDCKQINSYHIFSEKLKSYKAVYKYAKKKPKPCLELLCCRGKEQLKMRNKTRLSLCQNPSWRTDGVGVGWRSACIQTEKICRYYDPGGWFWYFTISILELSLSKGLGRKRKICGSIALIRQGVKLFELKTLIYIYKVAVCLSGTFSFTIVKITKVLVQTLTTRGKTTNSITYSSSIPTWTRWRLAPLKFLY